MIVSAIVTENELWKKVNETLPLIALLRIVPEIGDVSKKVSGVTRLRFNKSEWKEKIIALGFEDKY